MDIDTIKTDLRHYYNQEAEYRDAGEKQPWKQQLRASFLERVKAEDKHTLLELGAGTGQDSLFFMESGLCVTAVDLSGEMVKRCREKQIDAYEIDIYNLSGLGKSFDACWAMNSLLHVPKADLPQVLRGIDAVLNPDALFYMGVYGGEDTEHTWVNDLSDVPRFFSYYTKDKLETILHEVFDILSFKEMDVGRNIGFQSVVMRKHTR